VSELPRLSAVRTARLRIHPLAARHARALRSISDDPSITRAIHFLRAPVTLVAAGALIRGGIHGVDRFYGVWRKGHLIGVVGLGRHGDALEIGYWFGRDFQGRGLAREAVGAFVAQLRQRFRDRAIVAECHPANGRSWRLLHRLGFHVIGPGTRPGRELLSL
jgi:RimJ/RimL family protein N-acetyltransferase